MNGKSNACADKIRVSLYSRFFDVEKDGSLSPAEINRLRAEGRCDRAGASLRLLWREQTEGGSVYATLEIPPLSAGRMTLTRRGAVDCLFIFERGAETSSVYAVGGYRYPVTILTETLTVTARTEGQGCIHCRYRLTVGGVPRLVEMELSWTGV